MPCILRWFSCGVKAQSIFLSERVGRGTRIEVNRNGCRFCQRGHRVQGLRIKRGRPLKADRDTDGSPVQSGMRSMHGEPSRVKGCFGLRYSIGVAPAVGLRTVELVPARPAPEPSVS